ncbi:hypothetical protein PVL29_026787 [Vitis rotundifolia]|uniref:DUF4228 domain-containing protein n=1 Tax=Vitis rotundifolia TaxID=103349 RepID=A0AA39D5Y3_VITRO|nr:hypothetical protein PVL29_026787 [Vitis rotundifolia]
MGNCQAAEAATVVIQHPGNKIERIYWSVSAHEVMTSNPGHYVALVVTSPTAKSENGTPLKQLKLLRPDDTLLIGQVYRLVSFEGKLLKERGGLGLEKTKRKHSSGSNSNQNPKPDCYGTVEVEQEVYGLGSNVGSSSSSSRGLGRYQGGGGGQWKPALQSIAEVGT